MNSTFKSGLGFYAYQVLFWLILSPFVQACAEVPYWLSHGKWYSFSFADLVSIDYLAYSNFVGLNRLIEFASDLWLSVPVSLLAGIALLVTTFGSSSAGKTRRRVYLDHHLEMRSYIGREFSSLEADVSILTREATDLREMAIDSRGAILKIDDGVTGINERLIALLSGLELVEERLSSIEQKCSNIEIDLSTLATRATTNVEYS